MGNSGIRRRVEFASMPLHRIRVFHKNPTATDAAGKALLSTGILAMTVAVNVFIPLSRDRVGYTLPAFFASRYFSFDSIQLS